MRSHELGRTSENIACDFLKARGWRILERNYRAGHKEIDIIARRGATVAFIEVKARAGDGWGHALEAITWEKRRETAYAARSWMSTFPAAAKENRIAAIAITWRGASPMPEHVETAWTQ